MTDLLEKETAPVPAPTVDVIDDTPSPRSRVRALLRGRGLAGLVLVGAVFVLGVAAPLIAPYGPNDQLAHAYLLHASGAHLFGTDQLDRDVLSRVLYGIRVDVLVVFVAVPIGALLGSAAGVLATTVKPADVTVQRVFDTMLAFPPIIFAIGLTAITGTGLIPVMVVVVAVEIPVFGRLLRTSVLRVRALPFVESAEVIGAGRWWTMRRHVLPNAAEPLFVQIAISMSVAIFLESAMSFLGIGVRPPQPSLGSIIAGSTDYLNTNPMYAVGPLLVVAMLVLGFQLIAQAIGTQRRK